MNFMVLLGQVASVNRMPLALMGVILLIFAAMGWILYHWSNTGIATLDLLKMLFGFMLLVVVSGLAIMTLTLAEDSKNDPQVNQILTMLSVMGGAFVGWAFAAVGKNGDKK